MAFFDEAVRFTKEVVFPWPKVTPSIPRLNLEQNDLEPFALSLTACRVWDAMHTLLPGVSADDDLALIGGAFGTGTPSLQTYDVKAAGAVTLYARRLVALPAEYVAGQSVKLRLHAGMLTTVADTAATVDVEAYKSDEEAGAGSDLCQTDAQDINSLTLADKDFTIDASGLSPGDTLDARLKVAVNDAAGGTEVKAIIGAMKRLCDTRG